jgi:hypothetical protein
MRQEVTFRSLRDRPVCSRPEAADDPALDVGVEVLLGVVDGQRLGPGFAQGGDGFQDPGHVRAADDALPRQHESVRLVDAHLVGEHPVERPRHRRPVVAVDQGSRRRPLHPLAQAHFLVGAHPRFPVIAATASGRA